MIHNYHRLEMKHGESQYQIIVDCCISSVHNYELCGNVVMKKNIMEYYLTIHTDKDN